MASAPLLRLCCVLLLLACGRAQAQPWPAPRISEVADRTATETPYLAMFADFPPGAQHRIGWVAVCRGSGEDPRIELDLGFMPSGGVVQLAARLGDRTERFGPPLYAPPGDRGGFFVYTMADPAEIHRFLDIALRPGALVSNGWISFYNALPPDVALALRGRIRDCLGIPRL